MCSERVSSDSDGDSVSTYVNSEYDYDRCVVREYRVTVTVMVTV